jgi:hypothetical protein
VVRAAAIAAAALASAGCGSTDHVVWARPQTVRFHGSSDCGPKGRNIEIHVQRLVLHRDGWRVDASIVNRTGTAVQISRPHHANQVQFGVDVFETDSLAEVERRVAQRAMHDNALAERVVPPFGHVLEAGERWRGSFSGPGRFPAGRYVRIEFGRFIFPGTVPPGLDAHFYCVTDDAPRL